MFDLIDLLKNFWPVIMVVIGSMLIAYYHNVYSYWKRRVIKTPPILPFFGNLLSLKKPQSIYLAENFQKYGRIYGLYQGTKPVLCVADPIIIKRILVQDFNIFRNRLSGLNQDRFFQKTLVSIRDHDWKRIRSILSPMFTTSKLKKMESSINGCVDSFVNAIKKKVNHREPIMIRDSTGNFTMDVIAKCAFAIDTNAHCDRTNPFLQNAIKIFEFNIFRLLAGFLTPRPLYNFFADIRLPFYYLKSNKFFINLSLHLIQQRKESKDGQYDDMLQLMVNARHGEGDRYEQDDQFDSFHVNLGKDEIEKENELFKDVIGSKYLSEEEIVAQSMIFFLAGYETTATTLAHCFYELAMNQDVQQKLYNEIKSVLDDGKPLNYSNVMTLPYLDAVLSETLRKYPPLVFLNRTASEDYHIQEYDITVKKDRGVIIPVYAIHHDPEYYPDPERYDPERFMPENRHKLVPYTYLPFGGGPRNCIGMRFALTEAKLGIANLIKLFQIVKIAETPHKCAFATDTNAHSDSRNPFVENARKFFDFDLIRTILAFITPKALFDFLYKIHTPCFYSESVEFFKNLGSHLINQRKNYNERKFDDLLQLMIDAKHGNNVRLEKEDQFDSFHVNFGKEELEKENEIFKEIIGSKYLDEEEIIAQSMIFFSAGYETTANTMAMCLYELAINQNVQQKLFDEIQSVLDDGKPLDYSNVMTLPYLDSVLSETLRKHPPATLLMRQASEDYYIKEYDITVEKNNDVMIPVYAIHHDPEYYPDPERYDPERFMPENRHKLVPYTYLPFGGGPRNCIGMRFALTEAKLGIANMIKSFRIVRTAKTSDELRLTRSLFLLKTEPIFIGIEKR